MSVADRKLQNELIFRDSNERIRRVQRELEMDVQTVPFICECSDIWCHTVVHLTASEYERVRGRDEWFLIAPEHDASDGEIAERSDRFWILEKA
jgi:hypothetical protein